MFGRSTEQGTNHVPYAPAEELSDAELDEQIGRMKNSSLSPRKDAMRQERLHRHLARLGLDESERILGILPEEGILD